MAICAEELDLDSDRLLVERFQNGDESAFTELYARHFNRLRRFCTRRVGDLDLAEELAQEAFIRALGALPDFAEERRFYPWLTVIAGRLCIDHHRKHGRVRPVDSVDDLPAPDDVNDIFQEVDRQHVRQALGRVKPRHRQVLLLREGKGLTYDAICAELGTTRTTVDTLIHRARRALRREFEIVAGGRLVGLSVFGLAAKAWHRFRTRTAGWLLESRFPTMGGLAAPVAAGALVVGTSLGLGAVPRPADGSEQIEAPTRTSSELPRQTRTGPSTGVGEPASGSVDVTYSGGAPNPEPSEPEGESLGSVGPVHPYLGEQSQEEAEKQAEDMPVYIDAGVAFVGADPEALTGDVETELTTEPGGL